MRVVCILVCNAIEKRKLWEKISTGIYITYIKNYLEKCFISTTEKLLNIVENCKKKQKKHPVSLKRTNIIECGVYFCLFIWEMGDIS